MAKIEKKPAIILGGAGAIVGAVALGFGIGFGLHETPSSTTKQIVNNTDELFKSLKLSSIEDQAKKQAFVEALQTWLKSTKEVKDEEKNETSTVEIGTLVDIKNTSDLIASTYQDLVAQKDVIQAISAYGMVKEKLSQVEFDVLAAVLSNQAQGENALAKIKSVLTAAYIDTAIKGNGQEGESKVEGLVDVLPLLKDNEGIKGGFEAIFDSLESNEKTSGIAKINEVVEALKLYTFGEEKTPSAYDTLVTSLKALNFEELLKNGYNATYQEVQKPFLDFFANMKLVITNSQTLNEEDKATVSEILNPQLDKIQAIVTTIFENFKNELTELTKVIATL
ncbi:hypothetical protein FJO69_02545 [[Mycoplasma] falconis]|uniref:Uncharacterized protein n=1 Tax=[Mycoplasma] falconis TaxID=92403 RepID=A0A501X9D0_9BACT|nr:hypothetical protein [[Mycoplasma] falconis]TPE56967.1 hypothetical protein FJO69_02545 [[Mycoplasma] falconis]